MPQQILAITVLRCPGSVPHASDDRSILPIMNVRCLKAGNEGAAVEACNVPCPGIRRIGPDSGGVVPALSGARRSRSS